MLSLWPRGSFDATLFLLYCWKNRCLTFPDMGLVRMLWGWWPRRGRTTWGASLSWSSSQVLYWGGGQQTNLMPVHVYQTYTISGTLTMKTPILPGRKWRQSKPRRQTKFRQESHSPSSLQRNNTWNLCLPKWRPSRKNPLKLLSISERVLQNRVGDQARPKQYL